MNIWRVPNGTAAFDDVSLPLRGMSILKTKGITLFGIGGFELFLILLFGFLIVGPEKLPEIAKTVGKGIAKFRAAQDEMNGVLKGQVFDKDAEEPFKNPLDLIDDAAAKAQKAGKEAKKTAEKAVEKAESFSERKARYDRERAEKKAAEKAAAEEAAKAEAEAAKAEKAAASAATAEAEKPRPSAAELYGTTAKTEPAAAAAEASENGKGE